MSQFVLSPLVKVTRLDGEGRVVLHAGGGDSRGQFTLDGTAAGPLLEWLLRCSSPTSTEALVASLQQATEVVESEARSLVDHLTKIEALVAADTTSRDRSHLARWSEFGWRDAADFHLATRGLRFVPDEVGGVTYAQYFNAMLEDTQSAGEQPTAHVPHPGDRLPISPDTPAPEAVGAVLARMQPINRFEQRGLLGAELLPATRAAFGTQRVVGGLLGEHHLRSYPSGGARHPFELYLVSKGLPDVPAGVYRFDPIAGDLCVVSGHGTPSEIDEACFGKGGIRSAEAVLVITCRWLRHSWKYRYARSYRMLLLEAGHAVQALNLAMVRHQVDVYHCPSIDDSKIRAILGLGDDFAEGPVYALGLGHGGVR